MKCSKEIDVYRRYQDDNGTVYVSVRNNQSTWVNYSYISWGEQGERGTDENNNDFVLRTIEEERIKLRNVLAALDEIYTHIEQKGEAV